LTFAASQRSPGKTNSFSPMRSNAITATAVERALLLNSPDQ
jgi:hypothetical protein